MDDECSATRGIFTNFSFPCSSRGNAAWTLCVLCWFTNNVIETVRKKQMVTRKMIRATGKGIYWTTLVILFGLSQLWLKIGYSLYSYPEQLNMFYITRDGALLFFTLAITMSVTMDFWFDETKSRDTNLWKATAFAFYPIVIMGFVMATFSIISFSSAPENKELINTLSIGSVVMTLVYAIIGKAYLFHRTKSVLGGLKSWRG